jgi:hypothetical protein
MKETKSKREECVFPRSSGNGHAREAGASHTFCGRAVTDKWKVRREYDLPVEPEGGFQSAAHLMNWRNAVALARRRAGVQCTRCQ